MLRTIQTASSSAVRYSLYETRALARWWGLISLKYLYPRRDRVLRTRKKTKKSRKSLGGPYAQGDQRKNQTGKQAFQGSPKRTTTTTTNGYNWDVFLIFVRFHTEWRPGRTAGSRLFKLYCYWVFEYSNFLYAWSVFGCTTNDGQTKCGSWPGNLCQRARNEANDLFEWDMLTQLHLLANHKDMLELGFQILFFEEVLHSKK